MKDVKMKPDTITEFVAETEKEIKERPMTIEGYIGTLIAFIIWGAILKGALVVLLFIINYVIDNGK